MACSRKLRERIDYIDLDAVVISHLHADHFLDLVPYSYALTYAPRQQPVPVDRWPGTDHPARPELHVPPGGQEAFRRIVGTWGNHDLIENAFRMREYKPERRAPRSDPSGSAFSPCPTSPRRSRCASTRTAPAGASSTAPTAARPTLSPTSPTAPS